MNIKKINDFLNFNDLDNEVKDSKKDEGVSFGNVLINTLGEVNKLQLQSEDMKKKLAIGEIDNLHDVTIMNEKADIALQVTMSIRGKLVEAYKEIMRMQV